MSGLIKSVKRCLVLWLAPDVFETARDVLWQLDQIVVENAQYRIAANVRPASYAADNLRVVLAEYTRHA